MYQPVLKPMAQRAQELGPHRKSAVEYRPSLKNYVSRDPFDANLVSDEEQFDWLETQLELIETMDLKDYLLGQVQ